MKTPRDKVLTFRPDRDTFDAMTRLRERIGVPFSVQIRKALAEWLGEQADAWPLPATGSVGKSPRKRAVKGRAR